MTALPSTHKADALVRPHPLAWLAVMGGGIGLLALGLHPGLYQWWEATLHPLPPAVFLWGYVALSAPFHVALAIAAQRLAIRKGLTDSAGAWATQTLLMGVLSYRLLASLHRPPGPKGGWLLGNTLEFKERPLITSLQAHHDHGDVVRMRIGFQDWVLVVHPTDIWDICVKRQAQFHKPQLAKRLWSKFLGNGILANDGEEWKRQHKLVRPGFHRERIEAYGQTMVDYTEQALAEWPEGERRDFGVDMTALTLRIVAKTLFDADVKHDAPTVGNAMHVLNEVMLEHIHLPIPLPRWWPSAANKRKVAALDAIENIVLGIINERRASDEDRGDLLSMLVFARDEQGAAMSDKQLRDEAMTLFFAGHETTSNALTWMWYLLSRHPEVEAKLLAELTEVLQGRLPTVADLGDLPYLEMVVKESMRLLPSVWVFMREPVEDVWIGDHFISKGSNVMLSPFVTQRDPRFFSEPETFRPERFAPSEESKLPNGAYFPFAAGARICLGKSFALMEARLILATLVQNLKPVVPDIEKAEWKAQLALSPKHWMPSLVQRRARA